MASLRDSPDGNALELQDCLMGARVQDTIYRPTSYFCLKTSSQIKRHSWGSSPCQEQRIHQVESLLSEIPLVLDEDDVRERDRHEKLLEVRGKLAAWFLEVRHDNNMREVLFTFLSKLKEMHGQDIVFAPLPECETEPEPKADALVRKASSVSSLSTGSSSGSSVVSHKLFYLCHEGTVWPDRAGED